MKRAVVLSALALCLATPALAHRIDEYLQASTLLVSAGRLELSMRLAPGVAVASTVLDGIDIDRDGTLSDAEQQQYGNHLLQDLFVTLDDTPVVLRLVAWRSSTVEAMRRGQGEIQLEFAAALPAGGTQRRLVFENRHHSAIGAYLVNALVPEREIRITGQTRNYRQSVYELAYEQAPAVAGSVSFASLLRWGLVLAAIVIVIRNAVTLRRVHPGTPASTPAPSTLP